MHMTTYFLRASDAAELYAALGLAGLAHRATGLDGRTLWTSTPGTTLHVLGDVMVPTGRTVERDGELFDEVKTAGWHALMLAPGLSAEQRTALAGVLIDRPSYPMPSFAGVGEAVLPPVETIRVATIAAINAAYTAATSQLSSGYPDAERESWPVQIAEARRLLADGSADTPWIDAAAAERGIDRVQLARRIQVLDTAYRTVHGRLSGIRQRLERLAHDVDAAAADAREQLAAITWPVTPAETEGGAA